MRKNIYIHIVGGVKSGRGQGEGLLAVRGVWARRAQCGKISYERSDGQGWKVCYHLQMALLLMLTKFWSASHFSKGETGVSTEVERRHVATGWENSYIWSLMSHFLAFQMSGNSMLWKKGKKSVWLFFFLSRPSLRVPSGLSGVEQSRWRGWSLLEEREKKVPLPSCTDANLHRLATDKATKKRLINMKSCVDNYLQYIYLLFAYLL